jgi:hypothetical protein
MESSERISIYPMDHPPEKRRRILSLLDEMGVKYTYERY